MRKFGGLLGTFWLVFFLLGSQNVFAQKKLRTGTIIFEITNVKTKVPELKLMQGEETTFSFEPTKQKTSFISESGSIQMQAIYNAENEETTTYYDFSGQKIRVNSSPKKSQNNLVIKEIRYPKNSIKTIAGYICRKAEVVLEEEVLIFWITDRIKTQMLDIQQFYPELKGFPLEYVKAGDNTQITFMAKSVLDNIPEVEVNQADHYQYLTQKEFSERMGNMKFGF